MTDADREQFEKELKQEEKSFEHWVKYYSGGRGKRKIERQELLDRAAHIAVYEHPNLTPDECLFYARKAILDERDAATGIVKRVFVTATSPDYLETLREDAQTGVSNWTLSRHARPADRLLLYVTAPVMSFVAQARVVTVPELLVEADNSFRGSYCADIADLAMLRVLLSRSLLLSQLKGWGWPKQPRQSVRVPDAYVQKLLKLVEDAS